MAREANVRWDAHAKAYRSDVGPRGKNGRRTPVYFRTDKDDHPITESPAGKRAAAKLLDAYLDKRDEDETALTQSLTNPTVEQLRILWLSHVKRTCTPETYAVSKSAIGQFAAFAHKGIAYRTRRAATLTTTDLARFLEAKKAARRKPNYLAKLAGVVQAMLNWSADPQPDRTPERLLLAGNPLAGMAAPSVPDSPERFAEIKMIADFLQVWRKVAAAKDRHRRAGHCERLTILLMRCLVQTGARPHEFFRAQWADIEWEAGRTRGSNLVFGKIVLPPERWKAGRKTGKSRTVYLTPRLTSALRRESHHPDRHATHIFCHVRRRALKAGEVEVSPGLDVWNISALGRRVREIRRWSEEAKLPDEGPNRVVGYLFRHTTASRALMKGLDPVTVAALLGTSPTMLKKHYAHLLDSHLAEAAQSLAAARRD
ncbi:MAG: tyrosine-type recombinase/integrase [Isosphaeraceae bacterium]|nr:tyrosine-type recombinase/integrase [Isosphaeraceae bacterium]